MRIRESIKSKVDELDAHDLRIVDLLIDSLKSKRKPSRRRIKTDQKPYEKVISLLGGIGLSSEDIDEVRQERPQKSNLL